MDLNIPPTTAQQHAAKQTAAAIRAHLRAERLESKEEHDRYLAMFDQAHPVFARHHELLTELEALLTPVTQLIERHPQDLHIVQTQLNLASFQVTRHAPTADISLTANAY